MGCAFAAGLGVIGLICIVAGMPALGPDGGRPADLAVVVVGFVLVLAGVFGALLSGLLGADDRGE
jgi:hypothetical protein